MPFFDNLRTGLSNMRQNAVQTLADARGTVVKAYDDKLKKKNYHILKKTYQIK